jgi:proteic killer suppression protein
VTILFASERLRTTINSKKALRRMYGDAGAKAVARRMFDLRAAATLDDMYGLPGRCEELKGDRKGQFSLHLHAGFRLILEPADEPLPFKDDGGIDRSAVTAVRIVEVVDYHD